MFVDENDGLEVLLHFFNKHQYLVKKWSVNLEEVSEAEDSFSEVNLKQVFTSRPRLSRIATTIDAKSFT